VLGLVVMDPVRGVGQALDSVEVGDVVAVWLGQVRTEVAILLALEQAGGQGEPAGNLLTAGFSPSDVYFWASLSHWPKT